MINFQVNGVDYRADKLNAFEQCDIAVLLAPVLSGAAETLMRLYKDIKQGQDARSAVASLLDADVGALLGPLTQALAKMPREDRHFVITTALAHVSRAQTGGYVPICPSPGVIAFSDIKDDMTVMMPIVWEVLKHSLLPFGSASPGVST